MAGVHVSAVLAEQLWSYLEILTHWNRRINLVGFALISLDDAAIDRLFIEPLQVASIVGPVNAFIDIGSGGGSPGIPLALALPAQSGVLVEVRARKSVFLREVVRVLEISSRIDVQTKNFQELARVPAYGRAFDLCTVRAVRMSSAETAILRLFLGPQGRLCLFTADSGDIPAEGFSLERKVDLLSARTSSALILRMG